MDEEPGTHLAQPRLDSTQQSRVARLEHSASEHDLYLREAGAEALHRGPDEGDNLGRLQVDDPGCDGVRLGCIEDDRRELSEPARRNSPRMDLARELDRRRASEVLRNDPLEHGLRAPPVLAPSRRADSRQADRARAVHRVAADRPERSETHVPPVRADTDAVHSGPARDCDAPAARAPGAQDGEGVVADDDFAGPAASLRLRGVDLLLVREVKAGEQDDGEIGRSADLRCERVDRVGAGRDADVMRMAQRTACEAEQLSVLPDESRVGLRAPAVDREDGLQRTTSVTSGSSSPSTRSTWPISGWASNALRA